MREIVEIDRDFLNGITTETKKIKENSAVRGKVTIGLFDDEGKKVREIKTENKIMDWFKRDAFNSMFIENLGNNSMSNGTFTNSKYLLLTSKNEDEATAKEYLEDNVIGFAQKRATYSGDSTLQGTYNTAESSVYIDENGNTVVHEVYDFPTHACNGTIKSLCWAPRNSSTAEISASKTITMPDSFAYSYYITQTSAKDDVCGLTQSNKIRRIKNGVQSVLLEDIKGLDGVTTLYVVAGNIPTFIDYTKIESDKYVYVYTANFTSSVKYGYESYKVTKSKISVDTGEHTKMYSFPISSEIYGKGGGRLLEFNGKVIFLVGDKTMYVAGCDDVTGENAWTQVIATNESFYAWWDVMYTTENYVYFITQHKASRMNKNFEIESIPKTVNIDSSGAFCGTNSGIRVSKFSSTSFWQIIGHTPLYTYVKLTTPITKTNTNTMKVQYDFVFENPNIFGNF